MEIKNYAEIYTGFGEYFKDEDVIQLNKWLSGKGVKIEVEMNPDTMSIRVFKED